MAQMKSNLDNAREFYKGRIMILIAIENCLIPLPKQYPSGIDDWKENDKDPSHIISEKTDELLPSVERKKRNSV